MNDTIDWDDFSESLINMQKEKERLMCILPKTDEEADKIFAENMFNEIHNCFYDLREKIEYYSKPSHPHISAAFSPLAQKIYGMIIDFQRELNKLSWFNEDGK